MSYSKSSSIDPYDPLLDLTASVHHTIHPAGSGDHRIGQGQQRKGNCHFWGDQLVSSTIRVGMAL